MKTFVKIYSALEMEEKRNIQPGPSLNGEKQFCRIAEILGKHKNTAFCRTTLALSLRYRDLYSRSRPVLRNDHYKVAWDDQINTKTVVHWTSLA